MPYMQSRARVALEQSLDDIRARCRAVSSASVDPTLREYVLAAAIFLGHAALENYISDSLSDYASAASAKAARASALAPNLQAHLFIHKSNAEVLFSSYQLGGSEADLLKKFSGVVRGSLAGFVDGSAPLPTFRGSDIFTHYKYPSAKNLNRVFSRIGIPKVFSHLDRILRTNASALLESIGSLRTQLAHTGTLPGTSPRDVRDRLDDVSRLVRGLDRVLYGATAQAFGDASWRTYCCTASEPTSAASAASA